MRLERAPAFRGGPLLVGGLVLGLAGAVAFIIGLLVDRRQTMFSFLSAYVFVASTAFGALFLLMVLCAWRATWPVAFRRLLEAQVAALPLVCVAFVPIALQLAVLYVWVHPERIGDSAVRHVVERKLAYLHAPFFIGRAAGYLALCLLVGELLRAWSLRQDVTPALAAPARMKALSAATLLPVTLAISFASFDWICSLAPSWSSSIFGFYWLAGGVVAALSLWILCVHAVDRRGLVPHIDRSHYYALGRCLFAAVLVWAYFAYFQFMLIWIADKPDEARWFVGRVAPGWRWASIAIIIVGHFALPFVMLLGYAAKRSPRLLAGVSAWLLLMHYLDGLWCVAPTLHPARFFVAWQDPLMLAFVGGLALTCAAWRLRGHAVAAWNDPVYLLALGYRSR